MITRVSSVMRPKGSDLALDPPCRIGAISIFDQASSAGIEQNFSLDRINNIQLSAGLIGPSP
jgi:hypothetical protein